MLSCSLEKIARKQAGGRARLCACRALVDRGEAGPLAQAPGDRPVPGRGRLCPRLPLRPRAGRRPGTVRPAVPPGLEIYNAGLERLIRAAQTKDQIEPQGVIQLKVHGREQSLQIVLQQLSLDPSRRSQVPSGLRFRGDRAGHQPQPVRPGRALDRRSRDRPEERGADPPGAVLSRTRWPSR